MRVVINALSARYGGGKTYVWNLLDSVDESDDCEIFVLVGPSLPLPLRRNVHRIDVGRVARNPLLRLLWEHLRLKRLLRSLAADVYFCPGGVLSVQPPAGCRAVVMFRNMLPFDRQERSRYGLGYMKIRNVLLERMLLASMKKADLVIFVSDHARKIIEARIDGGIPRAVTIPHGISDDFKGPRGDMIGRPGWFPAGEYLLYVSFLELYKNQLEVVQGYALLRQRRKTDEKLVLVGHHASAYGQKVKTEIARLGLEGHVILTGTIAYEDLPALYHHAKLNLFASSCENCPNIMLEAMASGRPLLASNRPPMPEFGRDMVIYFDPCSPEDIAEKIGSVVDDDRRLRDLSLSASAAVARYDWKITTRETINAISRVSMA